MDIKAVAAAGESERIRELQRQLTLLKLQQRVTRALRHATRTIADGVAWKALRYDRMAIAVLGQGRRVGRLALGIGFDTEAAMLKAYWDLGVLALHNDLTNTLRHGDLTLVRWPSGGELEADVKEVKAGRVDPDSAQMRRIGDVIAFLQKGEHPTLADGRPLRVLRLPQRYRTHQANLASVIHRARRVGFAWESPSPCLAIMAVDFGRAGGQIRRVVGRGHAEMERRLGWWRAGSLEPFVWTSSLQRMDDRRNTIASIAPVTIFRMPPEDVVDVLLGFVDYVVYLNDSVLGRIFARHGIKVKIARPPQSERVFLEAERGTRGVGVPGAARVQMMLELMTPASLVTLVSANLDAAQGATIDQRWIVVFEHEAAVWS